MAQLQSTSVKKLNLEHYTKQQKILEFSQELRSGLSECGFVCITNHGIDNQLLEKAYKLNTELFNLPTSAKEHYQIPQGGQRAYTSFGSERAKGSEHSDLKEFWHIGAELSEQSPYFASYPTNLWPEELPEFRPALLELYRQLEHVALQLLNAIGLAFDLDRNYFPDLVRDGNSVLRLIHYPPVTGMDTQNRMRAAPHADINLMTLLVGASDSGLQLLDKNDQWVDVDTQPGEIVVDTGDMMAWITGNTLPSTVHRVINPSNSNKPRYSMPFFLHPHSDALLRCLPQFQDPEIDEFPEITAGNFLTQRLRENGLIE